VLNRLQFGYSENIEKRNLYFNYNMPFFEFLKTLRDNTASCTIPPLAFCEDVALYAEDRDLARTTATAPWVSPTSRRPRRPSEVGYTLNDGPWLYKPASKHKRAPLKDLANEDDYADFLDSLKSQGSKGEERSSVVMMHVSALVLQPCGQIC
jgi:hypothetical protein